MSELSNFLAEQILMEESKIKKTVVVYVGRFQPMHKGHFKTFQHLQKKFGKADVYIGTSNKTEKGRSPFNFKEKVKIMTTMFGIPKSKIVQVKNPYNPQEVLKRFNKETTAFVTVVGQKDASRLSHKYFQKYDGNPTEGYEDRGYLYVAPMQGGSVSGTEVRQGLSMGSDDQKEKFFKDRAYGKFNKTIFQMVTDKLSEGLFVPKEIIEEYMMEISTGGLGGQDVDDGPNFFIPNYKTFRKVAADRAAKLGYTVVNMIGDEKFEDYYEHPEYPDGPQKAVSYFPAGVIGTMTPNNQVDIYSSGAYSNWYKHVTRKAAMVGYDVIKKLDVNKDDKDQSTDDAKGAKELEQEFESSLTEMIKLPVKVGDTILMGRFKNKKVVVKSIGKDEHGMPTINGKKVVTFRLMKEGFTIELEERSKGKLRPADLLRRKAAMAGKRAQIARRRARTMKRRKPLAKLKKIAYKKAYLQVYDEFMKDLFPGMKKKDLSIQQAKIVHKNVLRKKKRVQKRARFRFLPALRAKEADKFDGKESLGYPSKEDMKKINQRLDNQRKNTDSNKEYQYHTIKENINESKLLMEGGAYGHMNHPFDSDVNLTFGQLKDIVNRALDGTLENTREKTDGQALAISWRDNRLVAARNKGHLKNKGENALDIKGVSDKFQGRGGLSDAYNFAMRDLSKAISSLSEKQREKVFKGGACFMNLEVIYPTSVNVVPYGQALLVFHGTMEYDEEGVAIGENQGAARVLAGMIKQVNQNVQSSYTIEGPPVVKLPKSQDLSKKKSVYSGKIKRLQKKYNLKDTDGVAEYHQAFWENYVDKKSPTTLDNKTKMGLVKRWAFFDKKFRLDSKNISDSKTLDWAKKTDKEKHSKIAKDNIRPFEDIFLGLGAEVLQFVSSALTVNPDSAIRDMKKRLDKTIKDVKKSGDVKKIQKLKLELQRLNSIGGAKKIVPNEGIVFTYNGKTFKLTGTFAPLNQILGIFF